jgi:hypothetical protein
MSRPKGTPKTGGGSRRGRPNKISADIKAAILAAFDKVGGAQYLQRQAEENPVAFMGLLAKVLPLTLTGDGTPVTLKIIKYDGAGDDWQPPIIEHDPSQLPASPPTLPTRVNESDLDTASGTILPRWTDTEGSHPDTAHPAASVSTPDAGDRGGDEVYRLTRF